MNSPRHPDGADVAIDNVIDLFSGRPLRSVRDRIIRIAPEYDGLEILYSNDTTADKLYSLKIVCWALKESGEVVGMVPWLNSIVACTELDDPLNGHWEGYRDPNTEEIFYSPPQYKTLELELSANRYRHAQLPGETHLQEIPDMIGTHAVLTDDGFRTFMLYEVLSWRLLANGKLLAMLVDETAIRETPVLPGDHCLYAAQEHPEFRYFFQYRIANKIKERDPEALAAISLLIEH